MSKVKLVAVEEEGCRDGTYGWSVEVDGQQVIEHISGDDLDMANGRLDPLWKALGIELTFEWE